MEKQLFSFKFYPRETGSLCGLYWVELRQSCILDKIVRCSSQLSTWNYHTFGNAQHNLRLKYESLKHRRSAPTPAKNLETERALSYEINTLLKHKGILWKQWSPVTLVKKGHRNTSFFHKETLSPLEAQFYSGSFC